MEQKEIKVLDKGFVRLIDYMGDDSAIVQAARVSYGDGTKTKREDRGLIRYLLRNEHTSPFEMVEFKFHIKMPIFAARQMVRHRTASLNEVSGRYSIMKDEAYIPELSQVKLQSTDNKQGRGDSILPKDAFKIQKVFASEQESVFENYSHLLEANVAKELARIDLPVSTYTEMYWKIDLHNLLHFLKLRMDSHAQYEIRVYAEAIYEIIKDIVPLSIEAFHDYVLNAIKFDAQEVEVLKEILNNYIQGSKSSIPKAWLKVLEKIGIV